MEDVETVKWATPKCLHTDRCVMSGEAQQSVESLKTFRNKPT